MATLGTVRHWRTRLPIFYGRLAFDSAPPQKKKKIGRKSENLRSHFGPFLGVLDFTAITAGFARKFCAICTPPCRKLMEETQENDLSFLATSTRFFIFFTKSHNPFSAHF